MLLEVALIKLCTPAMEVGTDSLLDRIRALEEKLEAGLAAAAQGQAGSAERGVPGGLEPQGVPGAHPGRAVQREAPPAIPDDVQKVVKNFRSIAEDMSAPAGIYLKKARLSLGGENRLMIVLPDSLGASVAGTEEHVKELEDLIEKRIGKKVEVEIRQVEEGRRFEDTFIDIETLGNKINMEITVED